MIASYLVMTVRIVTKDDTTRDQLTTSLWCQRSASQSGSGEEGLRHWMAQTNEQAKARDASHAHKDEWCDNNAISGTQQHNKECERQRVRGMLWGGGLTWSVIDMKCDQDKYIYC